MNKGFTLVEMLVSFVVVSIIAGIMMNVIFMMSDKSEQTTAITELSVLQSNLVKTIKNDLIGFPLISVVSCEMNCYDFTFSSIGTKRLQITDTTVSYGDYVKDFPKGVNLKSHVTATNKYTSTIPTGKNSILTFKIPFGIKYDEKEYNLTFSHQFNHQSVSNITLNDYSGANEPVLLSGMIPIKWNGTAWVKATENWYNYDNKEWANVALINSANRASYVAAANGTVINDSFVVAYLVWVPRYRYRLFNTGTSTVSQATIDIVFEKSTDTKSTGTTNGQWLTHPAFTFGNDELKGMWVGKFETTGVAATPTIKYGTTALTSQTLAAQQTTASLFNNVTNFGIPATSEAHIMKNTEWGAVAYLTNSIYGKNSQIVKNSSTGVSIITGCAGIDDFSTFTGCQNAYSTTLGQLASTTGNVYGIYDMSGGAANRVMSSVYTDLTNTNLLVSNSGLVQATISGAAFSKFIDKYTYDISSSTYARRILGDATTETRAWYGDSSSMSTAPTSVFYRRGGTASEGSGTGIFAFTPDTGAASSTVGFIVVIPGK